MPIRFACPRCKQTLGVATRKAGTPVNCPKCGAPVMVPAGAGNSEGESSFRTMEAGRIQTPDVSTHFATPEIEETLNSLVVFDRDSNDAAGQARASAVQVSGDERSLLVVPRKVVYFQAALLGAVALLFFAAGWWIGAATSKSPAAAHGVAETATVDVLLQYQAADGQSRPDDGAVVLVLPVEVRVTEKLSPALLDPKSPPPAPAGSIIERLDHLGGAYGRTDDSGRRMGLVVPQGGPHYVLLLSNHGRRAGEPRPQDLAILATYLEGASELLADRQYRLTTEDLRGEVKMVHEFADQ